MFIYLFSYTYLLLIYFCHFASIVHHFTTTSGYKLFCWTIYRSTFRFFCSTVFPTNSSRSFFLFCCWCTLCLCWSTCRITFSFFAFLKKITILSTSEVVNIKVGKRKKMVVIIFVSLPCSLHTNINATPKVSAADIWNFIFVVTSLTQIRQ